MGKLIVKTVKLSFWGSPYLSSNSYLLLSQEIQSKRQERKRRTTANPVYSGAVFEPEVFLARTWPSLTVRFYLRRVQHLPCEKPAYKQDPDCTWPALRNNGFSPADPIISFFLFTTFPWVFFLSLNRYKPTLKNLTYPGFNMTVIWAEADLSRIFCQSQVHIIKHMSTEASG